MTQRSAPIDSWRRISSHGPSCSPGPPVQPDLASLAVFPAPDEHGTARGVEIALLERERLTNPKSGAPEQHDRRAEPASFGPVADGSHDRDDLFDTGWVGWVLLALVAWWAPPVIAGHRDRRAPVAGGVEHGGLHGFLPVVGGWLYNPRLYCHREYVPTTKEERLQIRVGPSDKALLERAAAASHLNLSAFVIQAAASRAEEVLAERSSIRLSGEAATAFTEALERPAEVNERLASAMGRDRKFSWLD
jgi:uncharacterized protein (DUF1778 family)